MLTKRCNLLASVILLTVFLIPVSDGFAQTGVETKFPGECVGRTKSGRQAEQCKYKTTDGVKHSYIYLDLTGGNARQFAKQIGTTKEKFLKNPNGYMRSALKALHKNQFKDLGAPPSKLLTEKVVFKYPAGRASKLHECMVFDLDVITPETGYRADMRGMRCMLYMQDEDLVVDYYVWTQWIRNVNTNSRMPGFTKRANWFMQNAKIY